MKIKLMEVEQPIGTFYLGKMSMEQLMRISIINRRRNDSGTQRQIKDKKVNDIAYYCNDKDAVFPTPIILSVNTGKQLNKVMDGIYEFDIDEKCKAEIIDGQHRFEGIKIANLFDITLPVVIMFNLNDSEKAYIFSTINNNQTKVDKSLIYDLFGVAKDRSPYKTCHEIAKMLNTDPESPFCGRIKMLEKRQTEEEILSQGTFVTHLLTLITNNPNFDTIDSKNNKDIKDNINLVFRKYFINNKDEVIAKILMNYFSACKEIFSVEWEDAKYYILIKTTGYSGLIKALKILVPFGEKNGDLSKEFFVKVFEHLKEKLSKEGKKLTSEFYPSGASGESSLCRDVVSFVSDSE